MLKHLSILTLAVFISTTLHSQVNLSSGLVASYSFNGNANDLSGNSHNGTVNGANLVTDQNGNSNGAYSFNGTSDYIDLSPVTGLTNNNYTYYMLAKISLLPANGQNNSLFSIGVNPGYNQGINLGNNYSGNTGWNVGGYNSDGSGTSAVSGSLPSTNTWYCIVVTRDNNTVSLYVDGTFITSSTTNGFGPAYGSTGLTAVLGSRTNFNQYFNGVIDEFKIYDRAINTSEIQALCSDNSTSLNQRLKFSTALVYPNPGTGIFTIDLMNTFQEGKITISDLCGKLISETSINNSNQYQSIDLSNNPKGAYLMLIYLEGKILREILMVE
jgi:hypothetical protein